MTFSRRARKVIKNCLFVFFVHPHVLSGSDEVGVMTKSQAKRRWLVTDTQLKNELVMIVPLVRSTVTLYSTRRIMRLAEQRFRTSKAFNSVKAVRAQAKILAQTYKVGLCAEFRCSLNFLRFGSLLTIWVSMLG